MEPVSLTYLGVNSLLISDGESEIMIDPHFSRPSWMAGFPLPFVRITPNREMIGYVLEKANIKKLDAVLLTHTHYDHALDAPTVASLCGAELIGSVSAINLGKGAGIADNCLRQVSPRVPLQVGRFIATFITSSHLPFPKFFSHWAGFGSEIVLPLIPPARMGAYKPGEVYAIHIKHRSGCILVIGSAGYIEGSLKEFRSEVVVMGVGGLDLQGEQYRKTFFRESVLVTGAERVFLSHWDNFSHPITKNPGLLPLSRRSIKAILREASRAKDAPITVSILEPWKKISL